MEEKNRKNPFWNAKLTSEERLDWLLANMTLEEKIENLKAETNTMSCRAE